MLRHQRGFSLIEMTAAIMIMAVTLTALLQLVGQARRLQLQAVRNAGMALDARSLLDGAFALASPSRGVTQGVLPDGCHWRLQTSVLEPRPPAAGFRLYRLELELRVGPSDHVHLERFQTLRLARFDGEAP